jgi:hypothetical protein
MRCCLIAFCLYLVLLTTRGSVIDWQAVSRAHAQEPQLWTEDEAYQGDVADVRVFYEPLAPYGRWTTVPEYGYVWIPAGTPAGWRPYMEGRWVYTSYGWTWVAEQPWGWAPFHYGRWAFVNYYGWVWIPGTVWGPAWVVWRSSPGWIGWAPLPPHVVFQSDVGLSGVYAEHDLDPGWFCFVEERWLIAPRVLTYIASPTRNVVLFPRTRNITHYTIAQHRIVNHGLQVARVEKITAQAVPRMRLVPTQTPGGQVREHERKVILYHPGRQSPSVHAPAAGQPARPLPRPPTSPTAPAPGVTAVPQGRSPQTAPSPPAGRAPHIPQRPREREQQTLEEQYRREHHRAPSAGSPAPRDTAPSPSQGRTPRAPEDRPALRESRPTLPQLQQRHGLGGQPLPQPTSPSVMPQGVPPQGVPQPRVMPPQEAPRSTPPHRVAPQASPPPRAPVPQSATPTAPSQSVTPHTAPQAQTPGRHTGEDTKAQRHKQPPAASPQPGNAQQ